MAAEAGRVVDADGHVLEPADTRRKYLEPSYRDRAIQIAFDDDGFEVLLIGVVREMRERLAPLPADARRKVLGDNAIRFYKLAG